MSSISNTRTKNQIKSVSNNIKPGEQLNPSAGVFMAFFGKALVKHYSNKTLEHKEQKKEVHNDKALLHHK